MARHVPISEFKDHASELVAAAERGEDIVITRHGRPAIRLALIEEPDGDAPLRARAREAMARLLAHRERLRQEGRTATIEEMIAWKNEGQK